MDVGGERRGREKGKGKDTKISVIQHLDRCFLRNVKTSRKSKCFIVERKDLVKRKKERKKRKRRKRT